MIAKFNKLNRMEKPNILLCNPGAKLMSENNGIVTNALGMLSYTEAEELVLNFNEVSEFNFRINRVPDAVSDAELAADDLYKKVQNRRLLFLDDIGFFSIKDVNEQSDDKGEYKDVSAESIDVELQQRMIPYIEDGTYPFVTSGDKTGIIDMIVSTIPMWTIAYIDPDVAEKFRTFEDVSTDKNCLSFLIDDVQEAYECLILFDTINRRINIYDQDNYTTTDGVQTSIHLTKDDLISSVKISENADDLYTVLHVTGGDNENVLISDVNPLGTNTIYNFDYYLDWMSSSLRTKVQRWKASIDAKKDDYRTKASTLYAARQEEFEDEQEMNRLGIVLGVYKKLQDNIKQEAEVNGIDLYTIDKFNKELAANGVDASGQIELNDQQGAQKNAQVLLNETNVYFWITTESFNRKNQEIENDKSAVSTALNNVNAIRNGLNIFSGSFTDFSSQGNPTVSLTDDELGELMNYIFEAEYRDEYAIITDIMGYDERYSQMVTMYDRATRQLEKTSSPTQEFDIDAESFIFSKEFAPYTEQLKTGCIINADLGNEINDEDHVSRFFVSNITVNYDDKKLTLKVGSRYKKFDPRSLFNKVLGSVSKTANTVSYIKDAIYPIKAGELSAVRTIAENAKNVTMSEAISATDQSVTIDATGYLGRKQIGTDNSGNPIFDDEQIKIVNNSIVFTNDEWETCKAAFGKITIGQNSYYGMIADALIGTMILSENVKVQNENNNIKLDQNGISFESTTNNVNTAINDKGIAITEKITEGTGGVPSLDIKRNPVETAFQFINRLFRAYSDYMTYIIGNAFGTDNKTAIRIENASSKNYAVLTSAGLMLSNRNADEDEDGAAPTYYGRALVMAPMMTADTAIIGDLSVGNDIICKDISCEALEYIAGNSYDIIPQNASDTSLGYPLSGDITSGGTVVRIGIPVEKSLKNIDTCELIDRSSFIFSTRGCQGYFGFLGDNGNVPNECIPNNTNNYQMNWGDVTRGRSYITCKLRKVNNHLLEMELKDTNGFSNIQNNTPVTVFCHKLKVLFRKEAQT